uniref:THO complex subunit 1 n=1 Tax=Lygus hesperus TaxID=30085 RepID=A0A0A9ZA24_LYGHE
MTAEKIATSFAEMRTLFLDEVNRAFENCDISCIKAKWSLFDSRDSEKRAALEQALRDKTMSLMGEAINDSFTLAKFLNLVMNLCKQELAVPVLSVTLLSDILDSSTIQTCEKLFEFVEGHVGTWKATNFFGSCKNNILRMCNDLLRRLSKAQNTVFCGRILLFLAMYFPFSERSGLNVVSEFNVDKDNFMKYEVEFDDTEEEPLQASETPVNLDSNFYSEFWALQGFFRSPTSCYNKNQWKEFVKDTNAVLTVFKNYKLEWEPSSNDTSKKNQMFFTKFLTNQKLLLLQLSDTDFRRTVYLQFLILFQFLTLQIKTKQDELKQEQLEWVKSSTATIQQLIKDSPPDGEQFYEVVQLIMKREEHWSQWKNDGCPALKKIMPNYDKTATQKPPEVPQTAGDILGQQKSHNVLVVPRKKNEEEFTEIIDMRQNYLQYLPGRNVTPNVQDFLAESIQQSENAELKTKDKKVSDPQYAWIALKLLSMKSPHFFSVNQTPIPDLPDFVDHICRRIFREQNPGMLLPPLMPAPKPNAKPEVKKVVAEKNDKEAKVKVVKTTKGPVKVMKTASGKLVRLDANTVVKTLKAGDQVMKVVRPTSKTAAATSNDDKTAGAKTETKLTIEKVEKTEKDKTVRTNDKQEKNDKNDKYEKVERYEKSERYDKGKNEKQEKSALIEKSKTPVSDRPAREKSSEKKDVNNKAAATKTPLVEKDRLSRKEKERSPGKRKREADLERDSGVKKPSREKKDDRKDDKDDPPSLSTDQIEKISKIISSCWKKVAEKLGYKLDEIEYFKTKRDTDVGRALYLLLVWASNEEDATVESLYKCLKSLNLTEAMKIIA